MPGQLEHNQPGSTLKWKLLKWKYHPQSEKHIVRLSAVVMLRESGPLNS